MMCRNCNTYSGGFPSLAFKEAGEAPHTTAMDLSKELGGAIATYQHNTLGFTKWLMTLVEKVPVYLQHSVAGVGQRCCGRDPSATHGLFHTNGRGQRCLSFAVSSRQEDSDACDACDARLEF